MAKFQWPLLITLGEADKKLEEGRPNSYGTYGGITSAFLNLSRLNQAHW